MMSGRSKAKATIVACAVFTILIALPVAYLWFSSPDPKFKDERLSSILYSAYAAGTPPPWAPTETYPAYQRCRDALKHLGPEAIPLITAWQNDKPSAARLKLRQILLNRKIHVPFLTADRARIANWLRTVSEGAIAVAGSMQQELLESPPDQDLNRAFALASVLNSTDPDSRKIIASKSEPFVNAMLDRYEKDQRDNYPLSIVSILMRSNPDSFSPALKQRVLKLGSNSRYLGPAVEALRPSENLRAN